MKRLDRARARARGSVGLDQRRARIGDEGFGEEFSDIAATLYTALTISSVIFLASPSSIMVLSR
jgi:hypothetical protein